LSGDAVFAEGLTRVYRILGAGFYDPGLSTMFLGVGLFMRFLCVRL
jgi:hypothetical protein